MRKEHLIYFLICVPMLFLSCGKDKNNSLPALDYEELFLLRTEMVNRLDTVVIGIVDGTYPEESYNALEDALKTLDYGISRARAGDLILQFEVDGYILAAKKAINLFDDSRIVVVTPGTPAELFVNGIDHRGHIDFGSSQEYCGGQKFTVETWAKLENGYIEFTFGSFISTFVSPLPYKGWSLHYWGVTGTLLRFCIGTTKDDYLPTIATSAPSDYGNWFHIAAVSNSDARSIELYINGELKFSQSGLEYDMLPNSTDEMRMWAFVEPIDNSRCMSGYMKKFRIWNDAKTQAEINQLMATDVSGTEAGLLCAWDFTQKPVDDEAIPDKTGRHTAKIVGLYKWKALN
ncbi:MAG: LamG domain-containing protein [Prevotellaceae bacterium]|jgi:hypothetical protein|nr:LamG domain-containing protein [Prevotellaceae bacterium]